MQTRGSFLLFFFLFLIVVSVSASEVRGVVKDRETGELLVGATVAYTDVETGKIYYAISGLDGSYKISNIPAGEYRYHISYVGYGESSGIRTVTQDMMIRDEFLSLDNTLDEVVLISDNRGTDAQARTIEKESVNVINVISAKQIQLSPDITVANVIQRVSGLSIERSGNGDPQYAIIRGMDKRYNNTLVNGIKIPSPDNENRYVPLDIFPAVFLERLEVSKSLTADMEADAIGGTVNMVMKDAPMKETFVADVQLGANYMNFQRGFDTYDRSDLQRRSPKERFGDNYNATPDDFSTSNMVPENITPMPDMFANATYGNRFFEGRLGVMVGGSFQNSYHPVTNFFYDPIVNSDEGNPLLMRELIERETSSQMQRIAGHAKLDYNFNDHHSIDFYFGKYFLNEFRVRDQILRDNFSTQDNYAVYPVTRITNTFQNITTYDLGGKHQLVSDKLILDWDAVYSTAENDRPDDGVFSRAGNFDGETGEILGEIVYFQGVRNSRAWERNRDIDLSFYANLTFKPNLINEDTEFKLGGVFRNKTRDNYYNYYNYSQIFGQFHGVHWNDFSEVEFTTMANPRGSGDRSNLVYDAAEDIYAGYFNTKWVLGKTEVQAGVRLEQTFQSYEINELSASSNDIETSQEQSYLDFFPSISFKHTLTDKSYLKATYYKAISRPGFYEIVPTIRAAGGGDSFYSERGNADLRPSYGHSVDVRYEFFPNSIDQILLGVFYKQIVDPIEYGFPLVGEDGEAPRTNRILPQNYDDAVNFGIEADYRKYFNRFGLRFNYTYTFSEITTNKVIINEDSSRTIVDQSRPLQGQSAHIGNLSLLYKDQPKKWDVQLVVNYTGERIAFVSPFLDADHYMRPMIQLDFSVDKGFGRHWEVFVKANNILDTPYELYVKKPLAFPEGHYPHQDNPYKEANIRKDIFGTSFRLGVRYNL